MEEILYCSRFMKKTGGRFSSEVKIVQLLHYGNPSLQTLEDDDPSNSAIRTKPTYSTEAYQIRRTKKIQVQL